MYKWLHIVIWKETSEILVFSKDSSADLRGLFSELQIQKCEIIQINVIRQLNQEKIVVQWYLPSYWRFDLHILF